VSDPYDWRAPDGDQSTWSDADWLRYEARSNFITEDIERADRIAARLDIQRCATHPTAVETGWGCPDCVAFLRQEIERLRGLLLRARYHVEMNGIDRCVWGDAAGGLAAQELAREIDEAIGAPATPAPAAR
jgi:hypothetical protein